MAIARHCPQCKTTMSLTKKKCPSCQSLGPWRYRVVVRVRRQEKQMVKTKVVGSLAEAQKTEAKFLLDTPAGLLPHLTLNQAFDDRFLPWAQANKASWRDDESRWRHHVQAALGSRTLKEVTPGDVQSVLKEVSSKGLAPATVHQVMALIRRLFNFSIKAGLYDGVNPVSRIEKPRFPDNTVTNPLTKDDLQKLLAGLDACDNPQFRRLVLFLLLSGKRRGEALHLRWSDVDLEKGLVTFRATKNGTTQTLPVNARCLAVLQEAKAMCPESTLVFPSAAGGYYHSFDATWQRFRKRVGLQGYRVHDLRHTYASYLASSGKVDIFTLKVLLGHKSLTMTARYSHLINGALQRAVDHAETALLE